MYNLTGYRVALWGPAKPAVKPFHWPAHSLLQRFSIASRCSVSTSLLRCQSFPQRRNNQLDNSMDAERLAQMDLDQLSPGDKQELQRFVEGERQKASLQAGEQPARAMNVEVASCETNHESRKQPRTP